MVFLVVPLIFRLDLMSFKIITLFPNMIFSNLLQCFLLLIHDIRKLISLIIWYTLNHLRENP